MAWPTCTARASQERALALISIAHPKFRAELLRDAINAKYFSTEMADEEGKIEIVGPKELRTTYLLNDGTQMNFRPIHPTDEPRMQLFYKLSEATIYYRFIGQTRGRGTSTRGPVHRSSKRCDHRGDAAGGARRGDHRGGQLLPGSEDEPRGGGVCGE